MLVDIIDHASYQVGIIVIGKVFHEQAVFAYHFIRKMLQLLRLHGFVNFKLKGMHLLKDIGGMHLCVHHFGRQKSVDVGEIFL